MKTKPIPVSSELTVPLPEEIQVLPYGSHETEKGPFVLDEKRAEAIIADFESRRNDMVIDYEHQTLSGGEAPAAGWVKKLINKGSDGIWAVVEWTPRAVEYLKNREYRYLSPVFLKRLSDNKVLRLINAALTNQPAIDGMVPVVNKKTPSPSPSPRGRGDRGEGETKKEVKMQRLMELLGLPEDATEEQAMEAVSIMKEGTALREKEGTALLALEGEVASLRTEIAELKSQAVKRASEELVAAAIKEGKVTPAQRDWAMGYAEKDLEAFKVFIAKALAVVPVGKVTDSPMGKSIISHVLTPATIMVNRLLGINAEAFSKHNSTKEDKKTWQL